MNRFVRLQLTGEKPQYPQINQGKYLIDYLIELGYGEYHNGSLMPLDYPKIESWKNLSEIEISFMEVKALMKLSDAYVMTMYKAKDKYMKPPYSKI